MRWVEAMVEGVGYDVVEWLRTSRAIVTEERTVIPWLISERSDISAQGFIL